MAVRYEAKGCNVELELLSNCIGTTGKYDYSPYSANEHKVAHNANELFAQLPVGAARLTGSIKGTRALRTDYMMAGQYALPAGTEFKANDLRGPDCSRATHVVSAVYVGAFAMGAGESRAIEGTATLFGAGGGAKSSADVEVLGDEGDAEACKASQKDSRESERCAVPLRIGLVAIDAPRAPVCPDGSALVGRNCVQTKVITNVECPAGASWDGTKCAGPAGSGGMASRTPAQSPSGDPIGYCYYAQHTFEGSNGSPFDSTDFFECRATDEGCQQGAKTMLRGRRHRIVQACAPTSTLSCHTIRTGEGGSVWTCYPNERECRRMLGIVFPGNAHNVAGPCEAKASFP